MLKVFELIQLAQIYEKPPQYFLDPDCPAMPKTKTSIESAPLRTFPLDGMMIPALSVLIKAIAEEVATMLKPEVARLAISTIRPELLDVKQAAIYLGRSEVSVHQMIYLQALPVVRRRSPGPSPSP